MAMPCFGFPSFGGDKTAPDGKAPVNYGRRRVDRPVTLDQVKKLYDRPPSFTNQLPWLEVDPLEQVVLLADGHSIGIAFELRPVSTEARPEAWLLTLRDKIQAVLSSAIPEHDDPWIVQLYVQDETRLDRLADDIANYASPGCPSIDVFPILVRHPDRSSGRDIQARWPVCR